MILTKAKKWEDIEQAIHEWSLKKVVVIGCGSCSAQCGTGGTEGVKRIVVRLKESSVEVLSSLVINEPCDSRLVKKDLKHIPNAVDNADGFIVAACGSGAQTVREVTGKTVIVTTDTIMISQTEKIGVYHEKCKACGYCWLNETGGICPVSACAKSLLNGPCGGMIGGKCEVGNYSRPCAWYEIYNRLKAKDKLHLFKKLRPPRDWSRAFEHFTVNVRKDMRSYYRSSSR